MTSRELTSGFDFWSRGHLRIAVMHVPIIFGADIFIQLGVLDLLGEAMGPPTQAYSWSILPVKFRRDRLSSFQVIRI